jgi:hypothetical protein
MKHVPSGFLSDGNITSKLTRRNSFLMCGYNEDSVKPFLQRQRGIFKYSPDFNGEWLSTCRAFKKFSTLNLINLFRVSAIDTDRFSVPSGLNKELSARFFSRESFKQLKQVIDFGFVNSGFHHFTLSGDFES